MPIVAILLKHRCVRCKEKSMVLVTPLNRLDPIELCHECFRKMEQKFGMTRDFEVVDGEKRLIN